MIYKTRKTRISQLQTKQNTLKEIQKELHLMTNALLRFNPSSKNSNVRCSTSKKPRNLSITWPRKTLKNTCLQAPCLQKKTIQFQS